MFVKLLFPNAMNRVCLSLALVGIWLLGMSIVHAQTVSANFGNRSGTTPVVPSGIFSIGGVGTTLKDQGTINRLTEVGLDETRIWIELAEIYSKKKPYFGRLDRALQILKDTGIHPIAVIYGTPRFLGSKVCAPPTNIGQWGQLAAEVVAHVNEDFPGLLRDYEIWNEPELPTSLCVSNPSARLNTYLTMFYDAATAMHSQAKADGQPIRTGGPVLSEMKLAPTWVPALLTNTNTAPYVDFVSMHLYITGQKEIDQGMRWFDLYSITQSNRNGLGHYYKLIESLVRAGHQPNPMRTPIYVSEFNANWVPALDCCRNNPTFGSLWNTLAISDFLNVVYSGASAVPSILSYFNATGNYFCVMGEWNWKMDCKPTALEPYPQFHAFKLFASPNYLDLQAGGHMAASVTPTGGLEATAFYTTTADNVVVINPTSTNYDSVKIELLNPGLTSPKGAVYLLNSSHGQISSESIELKWISGGYSAEVEVPAYSTVALSVKNGWAGSPPKPVLTVSRRSGKHPLTVDIDSSESQRGAGYIIGRTIDFGDGAWLSWAPTTSHTYHKKGNYTIRLLLKDQFGQLASASTVLTVH